MNWRAASRSHRPLARALGASAGPGAVSVEDAVSGRDRGSCAPCTSLLPERPWRRGSSAAEQDIVLSVLSAKGLD